jgi:predicted transposase/invertase (TIGR01784 family)
MKRKQMRTIDKPEERVVISFDYALKRLLRNKANYDVLEGFLSELLMRNITVKNIIESEGNKQHAEDKYNKVDILVEDVDREIVIIELQFTPEIDYLHRMLYGTSKVITERMQQGAAYEKVKKVYSINIVYFDLGQGKDYIYHGKTQFKGLHTNDELQLSSAQRDLFCRQEAGDIYPEYYVLKVNKFNDIAKDSLDEWIYFLKHNVIKENFKAKGLEKAREVLDRDKLTREERSDYDYLQQIRSENRSMIFTARYEGEFEERKKREKAEAKLAKKETELTKKETELAKKEAILVKERAEKERALAEKEALATELAALKAGLNSGQ